MVHIPKMAKAATGTIYESNLNGKEPRRGKVRDIYDVDDNLMLIVTTDRVSVYDHVLPTPIPRKGEALNRMSVSWFEWLPQVVSVPHHFVTADVHRFPEAFRPYEEQLKGRSMLVRKVTPFPVECVVRGYLVGSGWKDYLKTGMVCGHILARGFREAERLPDPLFTPSTKEEVGHDANITFEETCDIIGVENAIMLRAISLNLYREAAKLALTRGIIIADTKFEFGYDNKGTIVLIDEVLTPDSSRFWPLFSYAPGSDQPSFDKQPVRDYVASIWDRKTLPAPSLPPEVVAATTERYVEAYRLLTGREL